MGVLSSHYFNGIMAQPSPDALRFLNALGRFDLSDVRVRGFRHRNHPNKGSGRKGSLTEANLAEWQSSGHGVYVVINRGGDGDAQVTEAVAMFAEWDDRPLEEQLAFDWQGAGFPEPSIINKTGGKSLHLYWPLSEPCRDLLRWRLNQARLARVLHSDPAIKNESRVMRLPGYRYALGDGSLGDFIETIHCTQQRFGFEELEQALTYAEQLAGIDAYSSVASEARKCGDRFEPLLQAMGIRRPVVQLQPATTLPRTEYGKRTLDDIQQALNCIPPRVPGGNTYDMHRNVFWGLLDAVSEAGYDRAAAISMMNAHSPEFGEDLEKLARDTNGSVKAGSFWYWAKEYGYQFPRRERPALPPSQPRPTLTVVSGGAMPAPDPYRFQQRLLEPFDPEMATLERYGQIQALDAKTFSVMLRTNYGARLRFNRLTAQPELDGRPLPYRIDYTYVTLAQNNWKLGKDVAVDVLLTVAQENTYCPVVEYLERVETTEHPLDITRLASQLLRPEDAAQPEPTIYDRMMEVNLIGAVRRVFEPGCQHDTGVILYSPEQGKRKTTFWETLAAGYFNGDFKDHTSKDDLMKLHRAWIVEWGEIDQITSKRDVSEVKHFMTVKEDFIRVPYGREVEAYPRRGILVGSTNREDFMTDDTGNRRFHVIPVTIDQIPVEVVAEVRDSLWAGAVAAYRAGCPNHLTRDEEEVVNRLNLGHLQQSDWHALVARWLDHEGALDLANGTLTIAQVLLGAIQKPAGQWTRRDRDEVARTLRQMGLESRRIRLGGQLQYVWRRP